MSKILITLSFVLFSLLSYSQSRIEERKLLIENGAITIERLFERVEKELGIEIAYLPNEVAIKREVQIEPNRNTLKKIFEEIFPSDSYRIMWKNDKILIKKLNKGSVGSKNIYGYVMDAESGEKLFGATVYDLANSTGVTSNSYGYFSLTSHSDTSLLSIRYLGYESKEVVVIASSDTLISVKLQPMEQMLGDVIVTDDPLKEKIESTELGVTKIPVDRLKKLPALAGEIDVIKNIQQLPGVQVVGEGTSTYYVRGGNYDQNLILLDEAPVYNPSHALGFFSVFNGDAIKDLTFYKSHIPVKYGGKLSSVLDIKMKEGNQKDYHVSGGLGLISSRLSVEGPIAKNKSSFILSARRTYADFVWQTLSNDEATKNTSVYFYDFTAKMNYKLGEKDQLFLSGFFGRDVNEIDVQQYGIIWDNQTLTLRWNHLFSSNLFLNTSLIYSKYNYSIGLNNLVSAITWKSFIEDYTAKVDFDWYASDRHKLRFGASTTVHNISPGKVAESGFKELSISEADALEHAVYLEDQIKVSDRFNVEVGIRGAAFQNKGASTLYKYDTNYEVSDSAYFEKGDIYHTYFALDPRIAVSFTLNERSSLKASYNLTSQFIHMLQNNMVPFSSFDQWIISNPEIKPKYAHHFNLGYYRYFENPGFGFTADVFYKKLLNQMDAADHAQLLLNRYVEGEVRVGDGRAYGFEVSLEKSKGTLQGIVGYTYSRAKRTISGINEGRTYNAPFDKPHTVQASLVWNASRRIDFGMNWIYSSGGPVTLPSESFIYQGKAVPVYDGRNQYRMPDYHRLDLSLTLRRKKTENVKNHSSWVFAVYNTYFRKNASTVFASQKLDSEGVNVIDPRSQEIYKNWLFGIVPSITYNFNF